MPGRRGDGTSATRRRAAVAALLALLAVVVGVLVVRDGAPPDDERAALPATDDVAPPRAMEPSPPDETPASSGPRALLVPDAFASDAPADASPPASPTERLRPLVVSAVDLDGRPVPGVRVEVLVAPYRLVSRGTTALDDDGRQAGCVLRRPEGRVTLRASGGGGFQVGVLRPGAPLVPGGSRDGVPADLEEVVLLLADALSVDVTVTSARDGAPLSSAKVELHAEGDAVPFFAGLFDPEDGLDLDETTDVDGVARFTLPGRGWRTLAARATLRDFAGDDEACAIDVEPGARERSLALALEPLGDVLAVRGVALFRDGRPAADLQLDAGRFVPPSAGAWGLERTWSGRTDVRGGFAFHWLPADADARLVVQPHGVTWETLGELGPLTRQEATAGELRLVLGAAGIATVPIRVEGTVPEGRYVSFVDVLLEGAPTRFVWRRLPDAPGGVLEADVEVPTDRPCRVSVGTMHDGLIRPPQESAVTYDPAAPPATPLRFVVERLFAFEGVLALPPDLPSEGEITLECRRDDRGWAQAEVARDGRFRVGGLPPGEYVLHAYHWKPGRNRLVLGDWTRRLDGDVLGLALLPDGRDAPR